MKIDPVGDVLMVKAVTVHEKTKGGLFLPQSARDEDGSMSQNIDTFEVLKVGEGPRNTAGELIGIDSRIVIGAKVMLDRRTLTKFKLGETEAYLVKTGAVVAIVSED